MNRSTIKTWLKRNRFKPCGWGANVRTSPHRCSYIRNGYLYRVRIEENNWVIDLGEHKDTFDRWANSTICTKSIEYFANGFKEVIKEDQIGKHMGWDWEDD